MPRPPIVVGIFGGMGPLTGYDFLRLFMDKIETELKPDSDDEHPIILFWSDPTIPRKDHCIRLLEENKGTVSPELDARPGLEKGMRLFKKNRVLFVAVPCNTFHYFREELERKFGVKILNMISIVADSILEKARVECLPVEKIGLLATGSTIKYKIYDKEFNRRGIEIIKPTEEEQDNVQKVIELVKQGKAKEKETQNMLFSVIQSLESQGVKYVVLGCTELPLVIKPSDYEGVATLISSTEELAQAAVCEISCRSPLHQAYPGKFFKLTTTADAGTKDFGTDDISLRARL